jgi:hypothetical protein
MDFLDFSDVSFLPNSDIVQLCEDLNTIIGQGIWYDTFQIRNTKWLWLENELVTTLNSDKILCGTFGLYPSYVAGILNSVKEINFYVLCNKHIRYGKHIRNCIAGKECTFMLLARNSFLLTSGCDTVLLSFEARLITWTTPVWTDICPECVKQNALIVTSLRYCVHQKSLTTITNDVLTFEHECKFDMFALDLHRPRRLANYEL